MQNVEFSALARIISTFCSYVMHNVAVGGRSADFSTFCTLHPGSSSMPPFNPAGTHTNSRATAT